MTPPNGTNGHANGHHANGTNGHAQGSRFAILPKLPPHNLEAEQGALGSMLLDNATIPQVRAIAQADDYYRDSHRIICRAIYRLADEGRPVDSILLEEELRRRDELEKIGGLDAILGILGSPPHTANARHYAAIVREKAIARELIEQAEETLQDIYSNQWTAEELIDRTAGRVARVPRPAEIALPEIDDIEVATIGDVRRIAGDNEWLWPGWLIHSHMTVLASEPGVGKTRLAADLCRRMWNCLEWPDGEMATRPPHTPSLWIAADQNHADLAHVVKEMGLPDNAVYVNAPPSDPLSGLKLDDPAELALLERRIRRIKPGLLVIDTINKATKRLLYRPEEADAFFSPILAIAARQKVPVFALTHLSRNGEALDRRIIGTARVVLKIARPEGDETSNRRRLSIQKSLALYPPPIGVTMDDAGNEYDSAPPVIEAPRPAKTANPPKLQAAIDWLRAYLSEGPALCKTVLEQGMKAGHAKRTLFRAKDKIGAITGGPESDRHYRLPMPGEEAPPPAADDQAEPEGEHDEEGDD